MTHKKSVIQVSADNFRVLQQALELYSQTRKKELSVFLDQRLDLKECLKIQKQHLARDLILNPINAIWAIPALTLRKGLEAAEKLGWEKANLLLVRIPYAFQTGYQKRIAQIIKQDFFFLNNESVLEKQLGLTPTDSALFLHRIQKEIALEIDLYTVRQNGFSDLASSGFIIFTGDQIFGDRSLDIFGIGKKMASLVAKRNAEQKFFLGKELGRTFYKFAPPPAPTTAQVFLMTLFAVFAFSVLSTIISVCSHPIQQRLGFRQKQMERLIDAIKARVLLNILNDPDTKII